MATAPDRWRAEQLQAETAERQHRIWLRKRGFSPEDLTILVGDVQENALHHAMREGLEELAEYIHKQVRLALVCRRSQWRPAVAQGVTSQLLTSDPTYSTPRTIR